MTNDDGSAVPAPDDAEGKPGYPPYHPLWHLWRTGVFGSKPGPGDDDATFRWLAWEIPGDSPAVVALIDNGVCVDHPYLRDRIVRDKAMDFASRPFGLSYATSGPDNVIAVPEAVLGKLKLGDAKAAIARIVKAGATQPVLRPERTTFHHAFPSHGTACAGLVVARPDFQGPAPADPSAFYVGVDPWSRLLPITTSLNPDPEQLIMALLYAVQCDVDVILLPRGISRAWSDNTGSEVDAAGLHYRPGDDAQWEALDTLIVAISEEIPVVCAAGNSAESVLSSPAHLSGTGGGVISVGACSYRNYRSGYSNYGQDLSLVAPSDDSEVFNRHQMRLDSISRRYRYHDYAGYAAVDAGNAMRHPVHSHQSIITLDIPGSAGYAGGLPTGMDDDDGAQDWFDPDRGAFTLFGGTSAAASIVAGIAALMQRKARNSGKKERLKGRDIKDRLMDTASHTGLQPDDINGTFGDVAEPVVLEALFGKGLVDARAAIDALP